MSSRLRDFVVAPLLNAARLSERIAAYAQGKGYGTRSIAQENRLVWGLLDGPPALAVDIGGNIGDYTAELRRRSSALEIHTFEPAAVNVTGLRSRFGGDQGVTILPFAVAEQSGSATLYSDVRGSGMASLAHRRLDHFGIPFDAEETVDVIRFEEYWAKNMDRRPLDIVKIDIEGCELGALKGFGEAIRSTKVLQFEFGGCNIDTRTYFQDFWYFFKEHDFNVFRISPLGLDQIRHYRESDEFFSTTNFIAVNRHWRASSQESAR